MAIPPQVARLQGSKFTSLQVRQGWTHFHVVSVIRGDDGWLAELAASCDPARRLTVTTRELKDRAQWSPGWTPLSSP